MLIATITCVENLLYHQRLNFKSSSKAENFQFPQCFVGWDNRCIRVRKETTFVLYLDKVGSDGEVLLKTEFLGLAEVNHARAEGIK